MCCWFANGLNKIVLDLFFNCLVAHLEETVANGVKRVSTNTHDENCDEISLASVCYDILSNPESRYGSQSHAKWLQAWKIEERRYFKREIGNCSGGCTKFVCDGVGIMNHYNIRADPELLKRDEPMRIEMRRFPCCCNGCKTKLLQPITSSYTGPSNTCDFWDVFKCLDGCTWYNDWQIVEIAPKKGKYDTDKDRERRKNTMVGIGWRMSKLVVVGQ